MQLLLSAAFKKTVQLWFTNRFMNPSDVSEHLRTTVIPLGYHAS